MKGKYKITVKNKRIHYSFEIKRNITIIRGDSGSGKTTLINMISEYENFGKQSGVTVNCNKKCRVISGNGWETTLEDIKDSIVFIDEGNKFVKSVEFANAVRKSDNYYVIVTRENLSNLPYSVEEIYAMNESQKNRDGERIYNGIKSFYSKNQKKSHHISEYSKIITEDSNSGFEFFSKVASDKKIKCISARGKNNIFALLSKTNNEVLVVADGAAFGCEIDKIYKLQSMSEGKITLYLPESFEWLVLKSGILKNEQVAEILKSPENFIESSKYFSWEQFFTELLTDQTREKKYIQYSKNHLSDFYLQQGNVNQILAFVEGKKRSTK